MAEHPHMRSFLYGHRLRHHIRIWLWRIALGIIAVALCITLINLFRQPSNDRTWAEDQMRAPEVELSSVGHEPLYIVRNIRSTDYSFPDPFPIYYDKRIKESDIKDVWFVIVPFEGIGAAHTLLSFGLADGTYLSVSVEARREVGEEYSPWKGLVSEYELIYVLADERDVIGRRVVKDGDPVYLYPTTADETDAQEIFADIARRIQMLEQWPESYNTITNNCTTNLADNINSAYKQKIVPWSINLVMPKNADAFAHSLGLLDVTGIIDEQRPRYLINEIAQPLLRYPDFSESLREDLMDRLSEEG